MITLEESKKPVPVSKTRQSVKPDIVLSMGYLLLTGSVLLYIAAYIVEDSITERDELWLFAAHYLLGIAYVIILLSVGSYGVRKSWRLENIDRTVVLLQIFLVAAYALNRNLPVFEDAAAWLCMYLTVSAEIMLSYRYFNHLPRIVNKGQHFLLGMALVLYTYMAVYIGPMYVPAMPGILALGIGLLAFVPIFLLIAAAALIHYAHTENRVSPEWIVAGAATTITFAIAYFYRGSAFLW
jgi:hypothetical protein